MEPCFRGVGPQAGGFRTGMPFAVMDLEDSGTPVLVHEPVHPSRV
jgi:hypothetical protein